MGEDSPSVVPEYQACTNMNLVLEPDPVYHKMVHCVYP